MESDDESGPQAVDYDGRYRKGWAYGKEPSDFLVQAAASYLKPPMEILSLGEGQGRHVVYLASLGHSCVGVDKSHVGLAKCLKLAEERGVADRVFTALADLESFDLVQGGKRWDAIVEIYCQLPPTQRKKLHRDCANALKPGGFILIECFARQQQYVTRSQPTDDEQSAGGGSPSRQWQRAGPTDPSLLVDVGTLISDFDGLVEVVDAREVEVTLQEGRFHRGPAVLTQFVGRRLPPQKARSPSPELSYESQRVLEDPFAHEIYTEEERLLELEETRILAAMVEEELVLMERERLEMEEGMRSWEVEAKAARARAATTAATAREEEVEVLDEDEDGRLEEEEVEILSHLIAEEVRKVSMVAMLFNERPQVTMCTDDT